MQLAALVVKEWRHICRDRKTLAMVLLIPILELLLFGYAIDTSVHPVKLAVHDADRSPSSRALMAAFKDTGADMFVVDNAAAVKAAMVAGRAKAGLSIAGGYGAALGAGKNAAAELFIDGSDTAAAAHLQALAGKLALELSNRHLSAAVDRPVGQVSIRDQVLFNPKLRTADFIVPGFLAIILQKVTILLTAFSIVREREHQTMDQLLVSPLSSVNLVFGKLIPYFFLSMGVMVLGSLVMVGIFDVTVRGSLALLMGVCALFLIAAQALGLMISSATRTHMQAMHMAYFILVPSILLSGFMWPLDALPWAIRAIGQAVPVTYLIDSVRAVVLRGAGLEDLWHNMLILGAMTVVFVTASVYLLKTRLLHGRPALRSHDGSAPPLQ